MLSREYQPQHDRDGSGVEQHSAREPPEALDDIFTHALKLCGLICLSFGVESGQ